MFWWLFLSNMPHNMSQLYQALQCSTQHCKITGIQTQPHAVTTMPWSRQVHLCWGPYVTGLGSFAWHQLCCPITRVMADINTPTTLSGDSSKSLEDFFLSTDEDSLVAKWCRTHWLWLWASKDSFRQWPEQQHRPSLGSTSSDRQVEDDGDPENRLGSSD